MGSEWPLVSLAEISERIGDGLHGTPEYSEYGEYYFINGNNLENGEITIKESTKKVDSTEYLKHKKELNSNAVLVSINGTIGNVALFNGEEVVLGKSACYINLKQGIHRDFVAYSLSSHQFQEYIERCATGSTIKNVSLKMMREFNFRMPVEETEQINAVSSIRNLDNKIQLNRQTNQTLEAMAQALFKSWFVDFDPVFDNIIAHNLAHNNAPLHNIPEPLLPHAQRRLNVHNVGRGSARQTAAHAFHHLFPQAFEQSDEPSVGIQGWIPKGWGAGNLLKSVDLVGGGTPKTKVEEYWSGDIPWFSVVDAPNDSDIFVIDTDKKVTQLGVDNSSTKILRKGTTIISARGTVGKCALVGVPMAMNQSCYGVQGLKGFTDEYVYYLVRFRVSDLQQRGHGSVFNTITKDTFESITSAIPAESVMASFSKILKPSFDKVLKNIEQSKELESLRDTLLPKLISGELRIPDTEQPTEALAK